MDDSSLVRRLRLAIFGICVLLSANNLLPYVGLRDDSCQTMFSSLDWGADWNNHLFMPQRPWADLWDYYAELEVTADPPPARGTKPSVALAWLNRPGMLHNTEAVRVAIEQLCFEERIVTVRYRWDRRDLRGSSDDACADPSLSRPNALLPVRLYEPAFPASRHP